MKKFLSVLTAVICITACAFSFSACGDNNQTPEHTTHNWSATYIEDGDRHYQTCDGCDEKKYGNHDYGTSGVCVCGKHKPEEIVAVTGVTLDKNTLTLEIGGTATLTATVAPENATDKTVTWESDKTNIATVDNTGKVTAISDGTAVITVKTANGKTTTCTVTVNAAVIPVTGVTLNKTEITLEIGDEDTLTATVAPDNATDKTVTYSVAPAGIVSVDNTGKVTAIKDGTATITATAANNKTTICSVTVNAPVSNAQVVAALDTYCKTDLVNRALLGLTVDFEKVSNGIWYISKNENNKILKAEYSFTYASSDTGVYYIIAQGIFSVAINAKDLIAGTIGDVTYSSCYRFSYNPTVQAENTEIAKAICQTLFQNDESKVVARYIHNGGDGVGDSKLGYYHTYTVSEVTDKGVNECNIRIKKNSVNDNEYASKLNNADNYIVSQEKFYTIVGTKLENNNELF